MKKYENWLSLLCRLLKRKSFNYQVIKIYRFINWRNIFLLIIYVYTPYTPLLLVSSWLITKQPCGIFSLLSTKKRSMRAWPNMLHIHILKRNSPLLYSGIPNDHDCLNELFDRFLIWNGLITQIKLTQTLQKNPVQTYNK